MFQTGFRINGDYFATQYYLAVQEKETQCALCGINVLGYFAKLRKATIGVFHACLSAWNNSAPNGRIFMKFDMSIFRKSFEKIQISLKSDSNKRYFT